MKGLTRALLVARTARFLRPRQLLGRLALLQSHRARPHPVATAWDVERAQSVHDVLNGLGPVASPAEVRQRVHAWRAGRLELIGESVPSPRTWRESSPSPLFAYHLHYHDILAEAAWVAAEDGDENLRRQVDASLSNWLSAWSNGGSPAWDAYPTAVRTVNWTRMLGPGSGRSEDTVRLRASLAAQIEMLSRSLEWHLDGNHLLRDAWALAIVPWCFESPWGDAVGHGGSALYWRILMEQVGADGVHEERSPMYHARVLRDALEVVAVYDALGLDVPASARSRIAMMGDALRWMRHMDGRLRLINDSAGDHALDLDRLVRAASMLVGSQADTSDGLWWARDAQFAAVHDRRNGDAIFADLGAPAPRHQPGHSHAAALSFEMDLGGVPLIVDGGCSGYDSDSWRPYLRGTSAHSTVAIDGLDQSEMWATFRIARRAEVTEVRVRQYGDVSEFMGCCRPFHRKSARHYRRLRRIGRDVVVEDTVSDASHVEGFLHIDPGWDAERLGERDFLLRRGSSRAIVRVEGAPDCTLHRGESTPRQGWRSPAFSQVVPGWTIRLCDFRNKGETWRTTIAPE